MFWLAGATGACIIDHSSHSRTSNIDKGGKQFIS